jgi:small subunit ribosomal protein S6
VAEEVTKVEDKQLRDYELVLVISPQMDDEGVDTEVNNFSRYITENGGVISEVEKWGKRKLAYPINHCMEGNYIAARFRLRPELCKALEVNWHVSEKILRHLLVKLN